jgi:hypothetical protein
MRWAMNWADWMKPFRRSVYFSISIVGSSLSGMLGFRGRDREHGLHMVLHIRNTRGIQRRKCGS